MTHRKLVVTGGAGFIGSNFILDLLSNDDVLQVLNIDALTYAGNPSNLASLQNVSRYKFLHADIQNKHQITSCIKDFKPDALIHFAAESHVDRSIVAPEQFILTNVIGTFNLLQCALEYWKELEAPIKDCFRFLHVSTDEVYGSLSPSDPPFTETSTYAPNSPYAASKAGSDHLVRAYHHTYGLPTLVTNCSNNYGPYQFPEKFVPLMILNALERRPLPIYGDGLNIRDWLFVVDHCKAIRCVLQQGAPGEIYNVGGWCEKSNIEVAQTICDIVDEVLHEGNLSERRSLIQFVSDRPGHDRRYAIDARKIHMELGWRPSEAFDSGIRKTVHWYIDNANWVKAVKSGKYRAWLEQQYGWS